MIMFNTNYEVYSLNSIQVMNEGHLSGMALLAVNVVKVDKHLQPLKHLFCNAALQSSCLVMIIKTIITITFDQSCHDAKVQQCNSPLPPLLMLCSIGSTEGW